MVDFDLSLSYSFGSVTDWHVFFFVCHVLIQKQIESVHFLHLFDEYYQSKVALQIVFCFSMTIALHWTLSEDQPKCLSSNLIPRHYDSLPS